MTNTSNKLKFVYDYIIF